ncbi:hypothetical protein FGO68_gene10923 [Halteria grandinella]|uniref:Transmembrane protein n=1 Tax=Halteria grandinella TaxID=5974 RepID=A0A8J8P1P9_HALGN|nr:hypothetical protein FGO68_gene10923 [Halteria grandinella]
MVNRQSEQPKLKNLNPSLTFSSTDVKLCFYYFQAIIFSSILIDSLKKCFILTIFPFFAQMQAMLLQQMPKFLLTKESLLFQDQLLVSSILKESSVALKVVTPVAFEDFSLNKLATSLQLSKAVFSFPCSMDVLAKVSVLISLFAALYNLVTSMQLSLPSQSQRTLTTGAVSAFANTRILPPHELADSFLADSIPSSSCILGFLCALCCLLSISIFSQRQLMVLNILRENHIIQTTSPSKKTQTIMRKGIIKRIKKVLRNFLQIS